MVLHFLLHYGYIVLFTSLLLELIAFPLPGEVLMTYSGFLVFQGHLNWYITILIAGLGTVCGITLTYWIGLILGYPFFNKYGHFIHLGPKRLSKVSEWLTKYGNTVLILAYFIPGFRHVTGYFSGISRIPFRKFSFPAYLGAFLWAFTFISLGKALGPRWIKFQGPIQKYLFFGSLTLICVLTVSYFYGIHKSRINKAAYKFLFKLVNTFHSFRRVKALISITLAIFLGLAIWTIHLIQHYLANEFIHFNNVTLTLLKLAFERNGILFIRLLSVAASFQAILILVGLTMVWVLIKAKDRILESVFLIIVVWGGTILEEGLQIIFHHWEPIGTSLKNIIFPFPSEQSLVVIAVYGFTAFLLVRHSKGVWSKSLASIFVVIISVLSGLNRVFIGAQNPSDILAGIVFGGVWLSINILLLETFRLLSRRNFKNKQNPLFGCK
jgi:membrane protein DedA with SNARE-associated domain